MKTLNTNEDLPKVFYIFLHSNRSWHLKWNFNLTNHLVSASLMNAALNNELMQKYLNGFMDYTPFIPNRDSDVQSPSSFSMREVNEYTVDYNAELFRKGQVSTKIYPSRFACIYAFGSKEDAQKASDVWGFDMSDLRKFTLSSELPSRAVKVNMQIISQMWNIGSSATLDPEQQHIIWDHYWSGKGDLSIEVPDPKDGIARVIVNEGVIWEYLIDGKLDLVKPSE